MRVSDSAASLGRWEWRAGRPAYWLCPTAEASKRTGRWPSRPLCVPRVPPARHRESDRSFTDRFRRELRTSSRSLSLGRASSPKLLRLDCLRGAARPMSRPPGGRRPDAWPRRRPAGAAAAAGAGSGSITAARHDSYGGRGMQAGAIAPPSPSEQDILAAVGLQSGPTGSAAVPSRQDRTRARSRPSAERERG